MFFVTSTGRANHDLPRRCNLYSEGLAMRIYNVIFGRNIGTMLSVDEIKKHAILTDDGVPVPYRIGHRDYYVHSRANDDFHDGLSFHLRA